MITHRKPLIALAAVLAAGGITLPVALSFSTSPAPAVNSSALQEVQTLTLPSEEVPATPSATPSHDAATTSKPSTRPAAKAKTPATNCLIAPPAPWAQALAATGPYHGVSASAPRVLSDGSIVSVKTLVAPKPHDGMGVQAIVRTTASGQTKELVREQTGFSTMFADDQWVVWNRSDISGATTPLMAMSLKGGPAFKVTDERASIAPKLTDGKVRWVNESSRGSALREFDLATKKTTELAGGLPTRGFSALHDNYLLFVDSDTITWSLYSLKGKKLSQMAGQHNPIPVPGTQEQTWYGIEGTSLIRWSTHGTKETISTRRVGATPASLDSADGNLVTWSSSDGTNYLTDVTTGGTVTFQSEDAWPRLSDGRIFPSGSTIRSLPTLTCS